MKTVKLRVDNSIYLEDTTWEEFEEGHLVYYKNKSHRSMTLLSLRREFDFIQKQPHTDHIIWLSSVGGTSYEWKYPRLKIFKLFGYTMRGYYLDALHTCRRVDYMCSQTGSTGYTIFKRIHYDGVDYYKMDFKDLNEFRRRMKIDSLLNA